MEEEKEWAGVDSTYFQKDDTFFQEYFINPF